MSVIAIRPTGCVVLSISVSVLLMLLVSNAGAQAPDDQEEWRFRVTPYAWAAGLKGDVATIPGTPAASVDASFSDIIENTDIGFMLTAEARKGRTGVAVDLLYLDISVDGSTPGLAFGGAMVEQKSFISTIAGTCEIVHDDGFSVDALAGARIWYSDAGLSLSAGALPAVSGGGSKTWVDPVVGLRATTELGDKLSLRALADVGGFGVSSDLTWQGFLGAAYSFSDRYASVLGYRHLDVDYKDGEFLFDVEMSGPVLGLDIYF